MKANINVSLPFLVSYLEELTSDLVQILTNAIILITVLPALPEDQDSRLSCGYKWRAIYNSRQKKM